MRKLGVLFFLLAVTMSGTTSARADGGELDHGNVAPQGLVVRDDGHGNTTVFKADSADAKVTTDAQAAAVLNEFVKPANQIASVVPQSELDQTSSSEAWYYYYGYGVPYYGYYYYGYNYYYQPCYNWYYGGYYYNYYYRYRW